MKRWALFGAGLCFLASVGNGCALAADFSSPLDVPAVKTARAVTSRLAAVVRGGEQLVAVGQLGRILVGDKAGRTWNQVDVPLSADLVAVDFPTPAKGWACGHYGVIVHTEDGGKHWQRQMDGRMAKKLFVDYYQKRLDAGDPEASRHLKEAQLNFIDGPALPFLDISFESEQKGLVVGAFGLIMATEDGGTTWTPWMERIDNPQDFHLNAIRRIKGQVYIASEQGIVFRLDPDSKRFVPTSTGYRGTFFGLIGGNNNSVIAYGLRGTAYKTSDDGKTWKLLNAGTVANIVSGARLDDGTLVLATLDGDVLASSDDGETFIRLSGFEGGQLAGIASTGSRRFVLVGERGVRMGEIK